MTDVTALRPLDPETALSSGEAWDKELKRWQLMIAGGNVPKGETPVSCIAKARYGAAFGWDPLVSVNKIYLVEGRPCLSAEAMIGLVRERMPTATIEKLEHTREICVVRGRRKDGDPWHEVSWSIDDARAAGLADRPNWKRHTRAMLWARCASMLVRELFSDVTLGMATTEELQDHRVIQEVPSSDILAAATDERPEVMDVEPEEVTDVDT